MVEEVKVEQAPQPQQKPKTIELSDLEALTLKVKVLELQMVKKDISLLQLKSRELEMMMSEKEKSLNDYVEKLSKEKGFNPADYIIRDDNYKILYLSDSKGD